MKLKKNLSLFFLTLVTTVLYSQTFYKLIDLGTLGGERSIANCINDSGWVAGQALDSNGNWHAFLWKKGFMKDLGGDPESFAYGINNQGTVVGFSGSYAVDFNQAMMWHDDSVTILKGIGEGSIAFAVNEKGEVAGSSWTSHFKDLSLEPRCHAVVWQNGLVRDLGEKGLNSCAKGINNAFVVCGQFDFEHMTGIKIRPCLWIEYQRKEAAIFSDNSSEMLHINNNNIAVGYAQSRKGNTAAALWDQKGIHIIKVPGAGKSIANSINDKGVIVGEFYLKSNLLEKRAFIYKEKKLNDLNTLVRKESVCIVNSARCINENGLIAGSFTTSIGEEHACVLLPVE